MAETATIERRQVAHFALLDPRELIVHPANLRKDLGDLEELKA